MTKRLLWAIPLMLFLAAAPARAQQATEAVRNVLEKAMTIQTRPDLQGDAKRDERAKLIRQLISENFQADEMAKESLGSGWDKLTPKQRSEFQDVFTALFQDSYTRMVLNFLQRETIEYKGESSGGQKARVETVIMRSNEHIPVDYDLSPKGGRMLIRDVVIDGVSIVDNYKATFQRVIKTGSFEDLLKKMRLQREAGTAD